MDAAISSLDVAAPAVNDQALGIDELLQLYARLDRSASALPLLSAMPFVRYFWSAIKFEIALVGDIFLMIPINLVVFIRNLFPGRWRYRCFSWRYLRATAQWIWSGEFTIPLVVFRPFVTSLLHWHFHSRLSALRHVLLLNDGFSDDRAKSALAKLDRAMEFWQAPATVKSLLFTWFLPLLGPATQVWQFLVPAEFMAAAQWARIAGLLSVSYVLSFLAGAFLVKRGLMLGATGSDASWPGFLPGRGHYGEERQIFGGFGLQRREFPLDMAFVLGSMLLTLFTIGNQMQIYEKLRTYYRSIDVPGFDEGVPEFMRFEAVGICAALTAALVIAWLRRNRLGRI